MNNNTINGKNIVGLPTITINEFRNKHHGRGAVPPPPQEFRGVN